MKTAITRTLLAGAAVTVLGLTGAGIASAATNPATAGPTSLIDKLSTTFHLNKDEVAKVFAEDRQTHQAQMQQQAAARLAQAVTDGKLTQAQADYITNAQKEIQALMGQGQPGQEDDATRTSVRDKMEALQTWAQTNNVDEQYVMGGHGMGGHGGPGGMPPANSN